ncbi:uncharacterized protein BDZ83DRAFT_728410 [Colletotrichum acutatum]|uniref:Uncharacterized protein n=1 Tax=Glomerella acutata TaxID=27357 RepID=A0AAD8XJG0_GLOAC|nr:uncharacterized protein BDZ83DRAFT_728410 [Colletotrichum acutatum]KAK1728008.1 hypothetical protein BDZ83DRAFT_728410 [Colletotrichum acutatum]
MSGKGEDFIVEAEDEWPGKGPDERLLGTYRYNGDPRQRYYVTISAHPDFSNNSGFRFEYHYREFVRKSNMLPCEGVPFVYRRTDLGKREQNWDDIGLPEKLCPDKDRPDTRIVRFKIEVLDDPRHPTNKDKQYVKTTMTWMPPKCGRDWGDEHVLWKDAGPCKIVDKAPKQGSADT